MITTTRSDPVVIVGFTTICGDWGQGTAMNCKNIILMREAKQVEKEQWFNARSSALSRVRKIWKFWQSGANVGGLLAIWPLGVKRSPPLQLCQRVKTPRSSFPPWTGTLTREKCDYRWTAARWQTIVVSGKHYLLQSMITFACGASRMRHFDSQDHYWYIESKHWQRHNWPRQLTF